MESPAAGFLGESYGFASIVGNGGGERSPREPKKKFPSRRPSSLPADFVKHTMQWAVRLLEKLFRSYFASHHRMDDFYLRKDCAAIATANPPEVMATLDEFVQRRTKLDLQAAQHRLHLIAENDFI